MLQVGRDVQGRVERTDACVHAPLYTHTHTYARTHTLARTRTPAQNVQFPEKGLVYDYYVDEAQCLMVPWEDRVVKFQYFPGDFNSIFVPTVETTRLTYFLDSLIPNKHHVMFVGNTGTGKTAIMTNRCARTPVCEKGLQHGRSVGPRVVTHPHPPIQLTPAG